MSRSELALILDQQARQERALSAHIGGFARAASDAFVRVMRHEADWAHLHELEGYVSMFSTNYFEACYARRRARMYAAGWAPTIGIGRTLGLEARSFPLRRRLGGSR